MVATIAHQMQGRERIRVGGHTANREDSGHGAKEEGEGGQTSRKRAKGLLANGELQGTSLKSSAENRRKLHDGAQTFAESAEEMCESDTFLHCCNNIQ